MRNKTLLSYLSIIFFSLLFIGQSFAQDKAFTQKNVGRFSSVSENGNQKELQGTSTAIITSTNVGQKIGGFTNPYSGNSVDYWAGTFNGTVDGSAVNFYCIDINNYLVYNQDYSDEGTTPIEITYILNNYYPYVSYPYSGALSKKKEEASAIQATLWYYADGLDVSTIGDEDIRDRVNEIIADVTENASSAVYPDYFTITPSSVDLVEGLTANFTITAIDTDGDPFEGLVVDLSTTSGILSDSEVTTDASGIATFTLDQSSENLATITASAQATVPQGTQYFHVERPNSQQKLVLANPTIANSSASAEVNWYTAGDCDLHNFTTYTQGGWGSSSNSEPGSVRDEHFDDVFPAGLTIGGTKTLTLTSADAVKEFLPSGGTASYFTQDYTNPTSSTSAGNLAAQVVTATLNIYFHDAEYLGSNETSLGDLVFDGGEFDGMTLYNFLALANDAIGGNTNTGYSYSKINDAATKINENFDNGTIDEGNLTCEQVIIDCKSTLGDYIWHDSNVNGIQDNDEVGIEGVVVLLFDANGSLVSTTTTDNSGYYQFTELDNGDYTVKVADANFEVSGVFESSASLKWYSTLENQQCDENGGDNDFDNDGISNGFDDDDDNDGINDDLDDDDDNDGISDDLDDDDDNDGISDDDDNDGDDDFDDDGISNDRDDDDDNDGISDDLDDDDDNDGISDDLDDDDDNDGISDDEDSDNDESYCDDKDSDGDENNSVTVTIDCKDDFTVDFGFFKTKITFIKSGPDNVNAGELINYTFKVINSGDIVFHGGATVYDPMLNPNGDNDIRNAVVEPGETWEFTASYTTNSDDCGILENEAWAIGKPQMPDGSYKEDLRYDDSHSVEVICITKASLGDRVWFDTNEDGIQDFGEDGVNDVVVNLYNCTDLFISTTTTDNDGFYLFDNLEPGSYYVEFVLPNGYLFTIKNAGNDSTVDSDADETTGKTICTDLIAGQVDLTWDAGIYTESTNDFDLIIEKTASNINPDDEAIVIYTITVTNNSNTDGTNITVSDLLPAGLIYQSSNPTGYDNISGIWNVGDISAGDSKSLDITVKVDYQSLGEAPIFDFGIASSFNLFVLKDVVQPSSDTEGKVAVGRNATFGNYSIGDKLPLSGGTEDVLIVGRKLTYTSGQVYAGNVVYGKFLDVQQTNLCSDGSIRKEDPVAIDFVQAEIDLKSLSSQLATKTATGTTTFQWGGLTLDGTEPILNVFEVDGNDLSAANSMEINVPNGSVVLVNVSRWNVSWTGGLVVNGTGIGNVIYNFYKAGNLEIQGIDIQGTILAPKAKVNFISGVINGQMICKFFEGQGQMNNSLFHGSIHGNPEITNCAEIQDYDQIDIDESNNISCAPIVVNVDINPNNGDDPDNSNQWVESGGTGLNEMIWSMYQGSNGLLVGTVGGNIYLNNDTNFELLNDGMSVTYIWSLYEFDGIIYAGTDLGLYSYNGTDWTKIEIDGDVRSITSLNNVLYAAVWGGGVFESTDNGTTWNAINEGLIMSGYAVQTLTVTDNNLFVGTFALGVLKYDFSSNEWVELPVGYPFIWSLATDVDNNIYAATSGGGVYASIDEGESWVQINTGLPNMHIYSVSVYGNDVYVSTWSGGVYKFISGSLGKAEGRNPSVASTPITGNWSSLGMGGIEVSSIMVDNVNQTLYAGTSSGTIYKKLDGVTGINSVEAIPTEFGLEQNYPNPFNPSTRIEFSIAKAGLYALKVFNVLGQEVAILANQDFEAGKYTFNFNASNFSSGIYFYKLVGDNVNMTKKMLLLK